MTSDDDFPISLPQLGLQLSELTGAPAPSYHRLWDAAVSGRIPVVRDPRTGRLWARVADLPAIARAVGMLPAEADAAETEAVQ